MKQSGCIPLAKPHLSTMKQNHFVTHNRLSSHDNVPFADPGLEALWRMQVDADCDERFARAKRYTSPTNSAPDTRTADQEAGRAGGSVDTARFGFCASSRPPKGNHPVDLGLDTALRLRALDTLQKQLVIIGHIVAQERLHCDTNGHANLAAIPPLGRDFLSKELDSEFGAPGMAMPDMGSDVIS
jgi:hypothetical protein